MSEKIRLFLVFMGVFVGVFISWTSRSKTGVSDDGYMQMRHPDGVEKAQTEQKIQVKDGKTLYQTYCAACHKDDGDGVEPVFPPLKQNEWVKDAGKLIDIVLNGMDEEITIDGVLYSQPMPGFKFLKDEEVVNIVNYVRSSFGNNYKRISSLKVQEVRKKTSK